MYKGSYASPFLPLATAKMKVLQQYTTTSTTSTTTTTTIILSPLRAVTHQKEVFLSPERLILGSKGRGVG